MSDDLTEQLPSDDARDTTPMLRQLLAEVREFRAETGERLARVETTLEQLEREIGAFKSETH